MLEHSELVQELRFKNEVEYRFYTELKRNARAAEVEEDRTLGIVMGDCRFIFSGGEILALKDEKIVGRKTLAEFAKRPAQTYRMLLEAVGGRIEEVVKKEE